MADERTDGTPLTITSEMVAQFMLTQQRLNEKLQESTNQINARLKTLLAATHKAATTAGEANTPLSTGVPMPQIGDGSNKRPKHSSPHPEKFTGEDESLYPIFRGILESKLRTDAQAIGGNYEMVWYAFGRLTGTASKRIFPWIQHTQSGLDFTVDNLFKQMDLAFLDLEKQSKAVAKINTIKQKSRPFREFLQEFDQTLMEANGWGWQEEVKKGLLKAALAREVRRELVGRDEPATYSAYAALIRKITDDLNEWKDDQKQWNRPQKHALAAPQQDAADQRMDWEPTRTAPAAAARAASSRDQNRQRAKWVSQQEMTRRKESDLCLRCGSGDHYIGQCHLGPARKPDATPALAKKPKLRTAPAKSKKRSNTTPATPGETESSEETSSVDESENE
jgi:hypothetical protein